MKIITALATPFTNGKINLKDFAGLLERQRGADGILCGGTTGEGGLLSNEEKKILIKHTRKVFPEKEIWGGISESCTDAAMTEAKMYRKVGADGLLVSPPSFCKSTKEGFIEHISKIIEVSRLPIMLYNAPSRCGYNLWQDAIKLFGEKGCLLKDAGSDMEFAKSAAEKIPLYCGNEELLERFVAVGAVGCVSVVENIFPNTVKKVAEIYQKRQYIRHNDIDKDETSALGESRLYRTFERLAALMFCRINPIVVKYMLFKEGIFSTYETRLPLTAADKDARAEIDLFWKNERKYL